MNEITAVQVNQIPPQQTQEKPGKRNESGVDFSDVLNKATERKTETAVPEPVKSERSDRSDKTDRNNKSDKTDNTGKTDKPKKSEKPKKSDDTEPAEELAAYANNTQTTNDTPPVEEEKSEVTTVIDSITEAPAPIVEDDFIPEVDTETSNAFSKAVQDAAQNLEPVVPQPVPVEVVPQNIVNSPESIQAAIEVTPEVTVAAAQAASVTANAPVVGDNNDNNDNTITTTSTTPENTNFAAAPVDALKDTFLTKNVTYTVTNNEGNPVEISGIVEDVVIEDGDIYFIIDGERIPFSALVGVEEEEVPDVVEPEDPNPAPEVPKEEPKVNANHAVAVVSHAPTPGSVQAVLEEFAPNLQNMFQQIALSASMTSPNTTSQLVLQLYPEHLGKLRIELSADSAGKISARIESGDPAVRALLNSGLSDLIDCLKASGVDLKSLEVAKLEMNLSESDLGHRSNLQQNNQQSNQQNQYGNSRQQTVTRIESVTPTAALYNAAVQNSYVDENTSVEFTA